MIELPLSSDGAQTFVTQLGDRKFLFNVQYNDRSGTWSMDITDNVTKAVIIRALALVLGQELLEPYNFGIGRMLVYDTSNTETEAGPDDMGDRVKVYWFADNE